MAQNTIALVADCDETLGPDTTGQLLAAFGVDPEEFFLESSKMVEQQWDPVQAYMYHIIELCNDGGPLVDLTLDEITKLGGALEFYPGVPELFRALKREVEEDPRFRSHGIRVEAYVISSGIEELLRASVLKDGVHEIWASSFMYDDGGRPVVPKRAISFTDKTRYLFVIQKGLVSSVRSNPYLVNEPMDEIERYVPFKNFVYVGDSAGDIPCMSLIQGKGGYCVGILSESNPGKTYELGFGRRANVTVPPSFEPDGWAYSQIRQALIKRADAIVNELDPR